MVERLAERPNRLFRIDFDPSFVEVDEFEHRFDSAGRKANFSQPFMEALSAGISPASLGHERVPDLDFFVRRFAAGSEGPLQEFFVCAALQGFRFKCVVIDAEKTAAAGIETALHGRAAGGLPAVRQFAGSGEADLIEHTAEINEAVDLRGRTAKPRNDSWIGKSHAAEGNTFEPPRQAGDCR